MHAIYQDIYIQLTNKHKLEKLEETNSIHEVQGPRVVRRHLVIEKFPGVREERKTSHPIVENRLKNRHSAFGAVVTVV